ncbi:hypothetical protein [Streptomyces viridochromogenes]|uniref:hypothetical protein n=1 Tax=Streptomyces viridochromogenes TaxID=1938 RepID=UPI000567C46D|nr:hypothetical protein [Streptomyces viridochromogenes]
MNNAPQIGRGSSACHCAGIIGALLLLLGLPAHESAHAVIARHQGILVRHVTLWALGGTTDMGHPPAPGAGSGWKMSALPAAPLDGGAKARRQQAACTLPSDADCAETAGRARQAEGGHRQRGVLDVTPGLALRRSVAPSMSVCRSSGVCSRGFLGRGDQLRVVSLAPSAFLMRR